MNNSNPQFSLDSFLRDAFKFYLQGWQIVKNGITKYWKLSFVLLCLFSAFFFFKALQTYSYFEGTSSYIKHYSHIKVYGDKLYDLEKVIANKETKTVSQLLEINEKTVEDIVFLHAKNIKGSPLHEDLTGMEVPFYIDIKLRNKDSLLVIQDAITKYMNTGEFIAKNITIENKQWQNELDLINKEYNFLDSLKKNYKKGTSEEIGNLFNYSKEKFNQKKKLEQKVAEKYAVSVLKPFQMLEVSKLGLLKKTALKYGLAFIFISLFLSTFLYWYNNPKDES